MTRKRMTTATFGHRESGDLVRTFGVLPVVDATADVTFEVTHADIEAGVPGDPTHCMFAEACRREFGSVAVLFYPSVAYADFETDGRRVVRRFMLNPDQRARLDIFDRGGGAVQGSVTLKAVPPSKCLEVMAEQARTRHRELKNGERELDAARSESAKRGAQTRADRRLMGLRVGTGGEVARASRK